MDCVVFVSAYLWICLHFSWYISQWSQIQWKSMCTVEATPTKKWIEFMFTNWIIQFYCLPTSQRANEKRSLEIHWKLVKILPFVTWKVFRLINITIYHTQNEIASDSIEEESKWIDQWTKRKPFKNKIRIYKWIVTSNMREIHEKYMCNQQWFNQFAINWEEEEIA